MLIETNVSFYLFHVSSLWSHSLTHIWLQETNENLLAEKKVKVVFVLGEHFGF